MVAIPISGQIKIEEYWRLVPESVEWLYVLQKLKTSVEAKDEEMHCVIAKSWDGTTEYLLKRNYYTATTISRATGLPIEKLEGHDGPIRLKRPKSSTGLPEPTVDYWGEA